MKRAILLALGILVLFGAQAMAGERSSGSRGCTEGSTERRKGRNMSGGCLARELNQR
jgi:hypothetical protein